jgi:hypothetical protein
VEWEASDGTLTPAGTGGLESIYTAPLEPPAGETVTVTARLIDDPAVSDEQTIKIKPVPPVEPAPELPAPELTAPELPAPELPSASNPGGSAPPSGSSESQTSGSGTSSTTGSQGSAAFKSDLAPASVSRPRAMLVGRTLVMTTIPSAAGRVRLSAYLGRHVLGTCVTETPAGRTFTCRVRLSRKISLRAPVSVRASLRTGGRMVDAVLPPQRVPEMKMRPVGVTARTASVSGIFWCSPSTLAGVLVESDSNEDRR